jgi:hypothetical protein
VERSRTTERPLRQRAPQQGSVAASVHSREATVNAKRVEPPAYDALTVGEVIKKMTR